MSAVALRVEMPTFVYFIVKDSCLILFGGVSYLNCQQLLRNKTGIYYALFSIMNIISCQVFFVATIFNNYFLDYLSNLKLMRNRSTQLNK
jgi:hypothetical protein